MCRGSSGTLWGLEQFEHQVAEGNNPSHDQSPPYTSGSCVGSAGCHGSVFTSPIDPADSFGARRGFVVRRLDRLGGGSRATIGFAESLSAGSNAEARRPSAAAPSGRMGDCLVLADSSRGTGSVALPYSIPIGPASERLLSACQGDYRTLLGR